MKNKTLILTLLLFLITAPGKGFTATFERISLPPEWGQNLEPGFEIPIMDSPHIESGEYVLYNSAPPTSGPHLEAPAEHKYNREPLIPEIQVHELEHGSVLLQYNCTDCPDIIKALLKIASDYDLVITAPYPNMKEKIAITAWGRMEKMDEVNEVKLRRFILHYLYKGDPASSCSGSLHRVTSK